jgi:hypothetical protein
LSRYCRFEPHSVDEDSIVAYFHIYDKLLVFGIIWSEHHVDHLARKGIPAFQNGSQLLHQRIFSLCAFLFKIIDLFLEPRFEHRYAFKRVLFQFSQLKLFRLKNCIKACQLFPEHLGLQQRILHSCPWTAPDRCGKNEQYCSDIIFFHHNLPAASPSLPTDESIECKNCNATGQILRPDAPEKKPTGIETHTGNRARQPDFQGWRFFKPDDCRLTLFKFQILDIQHQPDLLARLCNGPVRGNAKQRWYPFRLPG